MGWIAYIQSNSNNKNTAQRCKLPGITRNSQIKCLYSCSACALPAGFSRAKAMPTPLSVFLVSWKELNHSIKAKVARLITSSMTILLIVTLEYQQIVSLQPQTASHECNVLVSKSVSFCQIISRRFENKIKRLSRSSGTPVMSSGRRVSGEFSL